MPSPDPAGGGGDPTAPVYLRKVVVRQSDFPTLRHYPFSLAVLRETEAVDFSTAVTFFVGENGTGKSTLLEGICRRCGISIWKYGEGRRRSSRNPYEERLHEALQVEWGAGAVSGAFFSSRIFQDFTEILDEWASSDPGMLRYFGGASLVTRSHGQSLMDYFRSRYRIRGLYLLDEPETALSPSSQLQLLGLLGEMAGQGHAQFIVATHSPILLACPGARILSFDHVPVKEVKYEETEHYRLYRTFMSDPGSFLENFRGNGGGEEAAPGVDWEDREM